jgi:succinate dehydrogenase / fumarate reductase, flavoprotein subunit
LRVSRESIRTSVLIIGAGAAGLRTAIELAENKVDCLVVGKRRHGDAHTIMAAGGINSALGTHDAEDTWAIHAADTLREGHMVCDPRAVELLSRQSPERVLELLDWGCDFSLTDSGAIDQRYFGAQSFRRTCFAGDRTGEAILQTLVGRANQLEIRYLDDVLLNRLMKKDERVIGAAGFDVDSGKHVVISAGAVVIAAGGFTSIYSRGTSRMDENTGDAIALALQAGARLRDMEFVQFHPTGMVSPPHWSGRLVTEAVRGEGGRLFNARGERFMERYSPDQMELDARDVVARAIFSELREGRGTDAGGVLLDISHVESGHIRERLPKIVRRFADLGIDITREPMEVAPTAHYGMGGVEIDFETGETGVPGLYAVGEATAGVHGANRLGGNSLAETVVFGRIVGEAIAGGADRLDVHPLDEDAIFRHREDLERLAGAEGDHRVEDLTGELRQALWDHAGIIRSEDSLKQGLGVIASIRDRASRLAVSDPIGGPRHIHTQNLLFMLPVAEAVIRSALHRTESRGAHYRSDHPEESDDWLKTIIVTHVDGSPKLTTKAVPNPSAEVQAALDADHHLDYHHLE